MQGKETRKTKTPARQAVKKPYLKGRAFSPLAIRRGLRVLSYLLVSAVLYFFLGQLMVIDLTWLRVLINLGVIARCSLARARGMGKATSALPKSPGTAASRARR